jgi:pimeloyl-ACP methyl ester carboxylesterase
VLALDALGVDVAGLLDEVTFDEPGIADLAGGVEGLVVGLRSDPLTAPFVPAAPRTEGLADDQDYERAVRRLADSAALWGLLSDRGRARVVGEPTPRTGAGVPRSLKDLAADQRNVGDGEDYAGHIRVIEVPQARGSAWIVEISGTQVWDPRAGQNLFDITTDASSMAQDATLLADGVQQALEQAQAAPTSGGSEPVMLVGHSLGGIAAAGLASSPRFTQAHPVTHVVTMGSPVGRMPVPAGTEVLSLEHTQDAVPRLDGQPNPDRATWVTASRDLADAEADTASQAHDTRLYVDTAALVDGSADPSLATWRASSEVFFAGDTHGNPVVRDYTVERVTP